MGFQVRFILSSLDKYLGLLSAFFLAAAIFLISWAGLAYHNDVNTFGLAYRIYAAKVSFSLFLLFALTCVFQRFSDRFVLAPLFIVAAGTVAFVVGNFSTSDAPWRYQYVGEVGYKVPREYAVDLDYGPPGWGIRAIFCKKNLSGSRLRENKTCKGTYLHLSHPTSPHYVKIDTQRKISCTEYSGRTECRVTANTELGQLNYEIPGQSISPARAKLYENQLIDLLKGWRIEGESQEH